MDVHTLSYIVRRFTTGSPSDETHGMSNNEMTKLSEVSGETSTNQTSAGLVACDVQSDKNESRNEYMYN
jgi:hypothetical protein